MNYSSLVQLRSPAWFVTFSFVFHYITTDIIRQFFFSFQSYQVTSSNPNYKDFRFPIPNYKANHAVVTSLMCPFKFVMSRLWINEAFTKWTILIVMGVPSSNHQTIRGTTRIINRDEMSGACTSIDICRWVSHAQVWRPAESQETENSSLKP